MYQIAYTKHGKPGKCALCNKFFDHLERHHIRYKPEITLDICHDCHFKTHFYPERLTDTQKRILLNKIMDYKLIDEFLRVYGNNRVKLAITFAPSRRDSIIYQ